MKWVQLVLMVANLQSPGAWVPVHMVKTDPYWALGQCKAYQRANEPYILTERFLAYPDPVNGGVLTMVNIRLECIRSPTAPEIREFRGAPVP